MHFSIVEIVTLKDNFGMSIEDDVTLQYFTDYYGDEVSKSERKKTLSQLKTLLKGLAVVDVEKGEITVDSEDVIRRNLIEYHKKLLEELKADAEKDQAIWRRFFKLRQAGYHFEDSYMMFFSNGCGQTSMQFVEDLVLYAGETLYIGKIYDAHY